MKHLIVTVDLINEELKEKIREKADSLGYDCHFYDSQKDAENCLYLNECEIVYGQANALLDKLPSLKLLHLNSAGNDPYINHPFLRKETILSNASGAFGVSIAEHLIMCTLILLRDYRMLDGNQSRHVWQKPGEVGSIKNSVVACIGTGDICQEYATRARAFGPKKILGFNRSGRTESPCFDEVYTMDKLDSCLNKIDILVMAVPKTKQTDGLMSRERLAMMKESAILLNVGRGNSLDQDALYDCLSNHQIKGAALDVFAIEPLDPASRLWDLDNLVITPHASGNLNLAYTRQKNVDMFLDQLERFCSGRELINVVDRERWY